MLKKFFYRLLRRRKREVYYTFANPKDGSVEDLVPRLDDTEGTP